MKSFMKFVFVLTTAVAVSVFSLPSVSASEQAEAVQSQDQTAAVQNASSKEQVKKVKQKKTKKSKKKAAPVRPANTEKADTYQKGQAAHDDGLSVYNPEKDAAPSEGLVIEETNFHFTEPLLVRPRTDMIVIHHVGIPDGDTPAAAIHRAHLANGWAGIGYHYVIRKNGVIERGRPLAVVGAHAYGENYHTVGINVTGNFDKEVPTDAQMKSLTELVTALCRIYHIDPGPATIVGHRDVNSTDCPGKNLYRLLPQLRDDVELNLYAEKLKGTHLLKLKKYETEKP
ncbi:peptidoglycan recognition family protein [Megasphaera sp. DJF_B143]|uniref:peptidoglycan recognition protein family protein n=1 Tax=Megasphaera sp. DJF_B143 TaxID=537288 RepID=UPI00092FEAE1|nr:peptidoglycan recognition family protein [Megasphaera sp. DJF_B143]